MPLPPLLASIVEHSRKTDDDRFQKHGTGNRTKLYSHFQLLERCIKIPKTSRISTSFRTRSYDHEGSPSKRPGSLKLIFQYYSKLLEPKGTGSRVATSKGLTYDVIKMANDSIDMGELILFCSNYGLTPDIISQAAVVFAWQRQKRFMDKTELDYPAFVDVLARIALISFQHIEEPINRIREFISFMELENIDKHRDILLQVEKSRNGGYRPTHRANMEKTIFQNESSQIETKFNRDTFWVADSSFKPSFRELFGGFEFENAYSDWQGFKNPTVDMGVLVTGSNHSFKIQVQNRMPYMVSVEPVLLNVDQCSLSYDERKVADGLTSAIGLAIHCTRVGEIVGQIRIQVLGPDEELLETISVPVYANVVKPTVQSNVVKPTVKSRRVTTMKIGYERKPPPLSVVSLVNKPRSLSSQRLILSSQVELLREMAFHQNKSI